MTDCFEAFPFYSSLTTSLHAIGNHELDRGLDVLKQRLSETSFPWLVSNVFEKVPDVPDTAADLWKSPTAVPLGGIKPFHVLERAGYKFGFMGLASYDWLSTLDKIDPDDLIYVDFCKTAERLSLFLRQHHSCDFIIALTHMRVPDDFVLAENVSGVDLILGGHDHILSKRFVNGRWLVKSGTDFKVRLHDIFPSTHVHPCINHRT